MKAVVKHKLNEYADRHWPAGGFLRAVLANDLNEAVGRADEENIRDLAEIVRYVYNELPSECWGSYEAVAAWIKKRATQ